MSYEYEKCLELAGAKIYEFDEFGSYQGDWWAKVEYQGKIGWVNGSYGSCSSSDEFQSEFGDSYFEKHMHDDKNILFTSFIDIIFPEEFKEDCEMCQKLKKKMIEFGESYLDDILNQEEAEKRASKNLNWDGEAQEMLDFIKNNKI